MAAQYRRVIMDTIIDEYGMSGDYLPRLIAAMDRIPDSVLEYCMSTTEDPESDDNMIHLMVDECPENIVSMIIDVDEYDDQEIQKTSVRNTIAVCLYVMYIIAMNVPNHPHRNSNWQAMIQRYAKNGDIHTVMSRIVNVHMNRHVDNIPFVDEDIDDSYIQSASPIQHEDDDTSYDGEEEDDEGANDNLSEEIQALFRFDNVYQYISTPTSHSFQMPGRPMGRPIDEHL
jgi:hypothetical protein